MQNLRNKFDMVKILSKIIYKFICIVRNVSNTINYYFYDDVIVVNAWMDLYGTHILNKNLGDGLNYYLIKELTGKRIINYRNTYLSNIENFCCIGSIIDSLVNSNSIIWGAGLISDKVHVKHKPLKIHAVRGEYTWKKLLSYGIDCPKVFGDPALLLPLVYSPKLRTNNRFIGIIPHVEDLSNINVCRLASLSNQVKIIRLCGYKDWHDVIDEIYECDFIISSSLHGIIISDAYKIPNVWVEFSDNVIGKGFKFRDYYSSVNKTIKEPIRITDNTEIGDLIKCKELWRPAKINLNKLISACPFEILEKYKCKINGNAY